MSAPIRCEGLSKRFRKIPAVDDLQLEVPEGSIYALIGPNGAGKTTLIKMLVNILRPSAGNCFVLDKNTRRLQPADFQHIGYVSENQEMPEWMTVRYYMAYLKQFYSNWDDQLAADALHEFQLPADRKLSQLSRGMKMKAALASSLAYHPKLIILDEPFSGLDPLVRDEFIKGLLDRAADSTILLSSHDLAEVETFASHVGFLNAGRLECSEETARLYERFREIEITFHGAPPLPTDWPKTWSQAQTADAVMRFIDSQFDETNISRHFPQAANISIKPMSLREIFLSLARRRSQ